MSGRDELVFKPFAREGPSPVRGSWAAVEPRSYFLDRESLEDAHFDDRPELGLSETSALFLQHSRYSTISGRITIRIRS